MDIKVGSVVLVVSHPSGDNCKYDDTYGFDNRWDKDDMDGFVGSQHIVKSINDYGVLLSGDLTGCRYPPLSLKLIEE